MNKISETLGELAAALSAAQGEMPPVKFNATNPFLGNKYADLGAIIEAAKPILSKNGLAITQIVNGGTGGVVGVTTALIHKSGEYIVSESKFEVTAEKGMKMIQVAGSIITYLRRYAYASIIGIYAEADTDGSGTGGGTKKESPMVDAAKELGGVEKSSTFAGKTVLLHKHKYPETWGKKLIDVFVTSGKVPEGVPHLDGILQKLALDFGTPVDDVIAAVNDYLKEKLAPES